MIQSLFIADGPKCFSMSLDILDRPVALLVGRLLMTSYYSLKDGVDIKLLYIKLSISDLGAYSSFHSSHSEENSLLKFFNLATFWKWSLVNCLIRVGSVVTCFSSFVFL